MANTPIGNPAGSGEFESQQHTTLRDRAHEARERIASKARETTEQVRSETEHVIDSQKSRLADRIGHYGSAVHRAAHQLEQGEDAAFAYYTHRAAGQLDRMADYLRTSSVVDLRRDVERVARRNREVFFGGLFLAGFVLARMLKASPVDEDQQGFASTSYQPEDYSESLMEDPEPTPPSSML